MTMDEEDLLRVRLQFLMSRAKRSFVVSDEDMHEFEALLERPARNLPRLHALLAQNSPFEEV